ncbi:hypothetical protein BPAE_0034g00110 [Botrytis paeoniae]|uniref:Uncharacterized protein n=1 Tax=Botrytis paeoniae TaxID=278948 RepID=A0A4Z1FY27_9HELO|nr:hypothetical protein BPAE_0034g00110 [Botrytis paeoniae]
MATQSEKAPPRRETPSHERKDHLTESPNFPTSSSRSDRIFLGRKVWEDKRRDYEKKYGSSTSQKVPSSKSSRQNSSNKKLGKGSNHEWGGTKDSPTDSSEGEGGVHWLDALLAENLSPAEFNDRINKRNAQPDPDIEHLKQKNAEMDAIMKRHKEKAAAILKKKEELSAWRLTGKPPRRVGRVGDRSTTENEYQRVERERSRIQREYGEPSQLLDWDKPEVQNINGGKSKGYEDMEDWWKPFQREPRDPMITTLKDPVRVKPSVKSAKWGEGLGTGGKHIQPFAGGHLPFHNEPESPLDAAERLENLLGANEEYKYKYKGASAKKVQQPLDENGEYKYKHKSSSAKKVQKPLDVNEEYKHKYKSSSAKKVQRPLDANKQEKVKKSSPIEEAIRNSPLSYFQNDHAADVSWIQILVFVVTGMLITELGLKIAGVTSDTQDISGSSKWGLGKTVE